MEVWGLKETTSQTAAARAVTAAAAAVALAVAVESLEVALATPVRLLVNFVSVSQRMAGYMPSTSTGIRMEWGSHPW